MYVLYRPEFGVGVPILLESSGLALASWNTLMNAYEAEALVYSTSNNLHNGNNGSEGSENSSGGEASSEPTAAASGKYDYGEYGGDFAENAEKIRKDLGIPNNWIYKAGKKDGGVRFVDPNNAGNHIRVQPGRPNSQFPNSQKPYTVRYKNGSPVDKAGRKISNPTGHNQNESPDLHVPLTEFKF